MAAPKRLLIVDDDPLFAETLARSLAPLLPRMEILTVYSVSALEFQLHDSRLDAVILDLSLDPRQGVESGFRALHLMANLLRDTRVIVLTSHGSEQYGIRAVEIGASSFIEKPGNPQQIAALVLDAVRQKELLELARRGKVSRVEWLAEQIVGESQLLCNLRQQILFASRSKEPIHIFGEVGSGKSLAIKMLEALSSDTQKRTLNINCRDPQLDIFKLTEALSLVCDDENCFDLSGYSQVVFQDPQALSAIERRGLLAKIKSEFLGDVAHLAIKVPRLIFSYQLRELSENFSCSAFPEVQDLSGLIIFIPALRDYGDDFSLVSVALLDRINEEHSLRVEKIDESAMSQLEAYCWPGNLRELQQVLSRAAFEAAGRQSLRITERDLSISAS